jgi:hypothetical protein
MRRNRWMFKAVVYVTLFVLLVSTLLFALQMFI